MTSSHDLLGEALEIIANAYRMVALVEATVGPLSETDRRRLWYAALHQPSAVVGMYEEFRDR